MSDLRQVLQKFERTIRDNERAGTSSSGMYLSNVAGRGTGAAVPAKRWGGSGRQAQSGRRLSLAVLPAAPQPPAPPARPTAVENRLNRRASLVGALPPVPAAADRVRVRQGSTGSGTYSTVESSATDGTAPDVALAADRRRQFARGISERSIKEDRDTSASASNSDPLFYVAMPATDGDGFPMAPPSVEGPATERKRSVASGGLLRRRQASISGRNSSCGSGPAGEESASSPQERRDSQKGDPTSSSSSATEELCDAVGGLRIAPDGTGLNATALAALGSSTSRRSRRQRSNRTNSTSSHASLPDDDALGNAEPAKARRGRRQRSGRTGAVAPPTTPTEDRATPRSRRAAEPSDTKPTAAARSNSGREGSTSAAPAASAPDTSVRRSSSGKTCRSSARDRSSRAVSTDEDRPISDVEQAA